MKQLSILYKTIDFTMNAFVVYSYINIYNVTILKFPVKKRIRSNRKLEL
jgi:hypothetical protein